MKSAVEALKAEMDRQHLSGRKDWDYERLTAAVRDWTPPPGPTLGEIGKKAFKKIAGFLPTCPDDDPAWEAAGEACATAGAAKERAEIQVAVEEAIKKWPAGITLSTLLAGVFDARGKPEPKPEPASDTVTLNCGCTMTKGWRCPVHGQP